MKIVRVIFFVVLVFVILLPFTVTSQGQYEHKTINYVALGDSIAGGYGLDDVETESYVGRVANALSEKYGAVKLTNFGENGLRSDELLRILTDGTEERHAEYIEAIREADIITLSIGSNDLLRYISRDTNLEEFKKNGDELFTDACRQFEENIPLILKAIKLNAPQAQLFVNNIYNPCNDISFGIPEDVIKNLTQMAENYICQINNGFTGEKVQSVFNNKSLSGSAEGYVLIDVKGAFESSDDKLVNMMVSWGSIDPHPNTKGHKVIAELIIPKISLDK